MDEEIEPAEAEAIKEAATRVLRGESIRSIAFDFNDRGIKPVGAGRWVGSTLRRILVSPGIAGLWEHNGEVVGDAAWPAILDHATHDRLVGLLGPESASREFRQACPPARRSGLLRVVWREDDDGDRASAGTRLRLPEGREPICPARVRVAEPLEAYVEGYVIEQWWNPEAIKIAQSDDDRMARIREITDEMRHLQEQKNETLRMKLRDGGRGHNVSRGHGGDRRGP